VEGGVIRTASEDASELSEGSLRILMGIGVSCKSAIIAEIKKIIVPPK
jgi:ABC-type proline/glycine betaine transport system ATPase subunit